MRKSAATAPRTQASERTEPSSRRDAVKTGEGRSRISAKEIQADLSPLDFSQVSGSPTTGADPASAGEAGTATDVPANSDHSPSGFQAARPLVQARSVDWKRPLANPATTSSGEKTPSWTVLRATWICEVSSMTIS